MVSIMTTPIIQPLFSSSIILAILVAMDPPNEWPSKTKFVNLNVLIINLITESAYLHIELMSSDYSEV